MQNIRKFFIYISMCCLCFGWNSCANDDDDMVGDGCPTPTTVYESGVFVVNEGAFGNGTGTLSFFNSANGEVSNRIYQKANCEEVIGSVLQSVTEEDDRFYLVVNDAQKVIVADAKNMEKLGQIEGLQQPRYFLKIDETTAYVTQWVGTQQGNIAVVNLPDLSIRATIPAGGGPEAIIKYQDKIYVANEGGQNFTVGDSTVLVINPLTHEVEKTLIVGRSPNAFQIDKNGDLWVSCRGYSPNFIDNDPANINGSLVRINNETVQETIDLGTLGAQKMQINPSRDRLYFLQNGIAYYPVYAFDIDTKTVTSSPFIDQEAYGLGVNPLNGHIFVADAKSFAATGEISEYDANGQFLQSFPTSIGPNSFLFK